MKIVSSTAFVEILPQAEQVFPDLAIRAEIAQEGFGGAVGDVYIAPAAFQAFVRQLEDLQEDRGTEAVLLNLSSGTSYDPLELVITKSDFLGHLSTHATVRKTVFYLGRTDVITASI